MHLGLACGKTQRYTLKLVALVVILCEPHQQFLVLPISNTFFVVGIFTLVWFWFFIHSNNIALCPIFFSSRVELSKLWLAQLESMKAFGHLGFIFYSSHELRASNLQSQLNRSIDLDDHKVDKIPFYFYKIKLATKSVAVASNGEKTE